MNIRVQIAAAMIGAFVSPVAVAETVYDTTDASSERRSRNQMAVDCDGSTRGRCFLEMRKAFDVIDEYYFVNYTKGLLGGTPEYDQAAAVRKRDLHGLTRAQIMDLAAELQAAAKD